MKIVLGMGCDRGTSQATLESVIDIALDIAKLQRNHVCALATIEQKKDEVGLLSLSSQYDWPLTFFTAEELSKIDVPNPSAVVLKYMGTPAVAEAAALLAAKSEKKDLIVEKVKYRGNDNKNATVSIVRMYNE